MLDLMITILTVMVGAFGLFFLIGLSVIFALWWMENRR